MRKIIVGLVVAAVAAFLPAPPVAADHCDASIYVFSLVKVDEETSVGSVTPEATCFALTESDGVDSRVIYPGSNAIQVRFLEAGVGEQLQGVVNGLGADNVPITLQQVDLGFGLVVYDSELVDIDPLATGYLEVSVDVPTGPDPEDIITFTDTYRTVDQSSPSDGHLP